MCKLGWRYFGKAASTGASIATRLTFFDKAASTGTRLELHVLLHSQCTVYSYLTYHDTSHVRTTSVLAQVDIGA